MAAAEPDYLLPTSSSSHPRFHSTARLSPEGAGAAVFVWLVWLMLLAAALVHVSKYASCTPLMDDWAHVVAWLAGNRTLADTWQWLWAPFYEHRFPLLRAVFAGITLLAGGDFRAVPFAGVLAAGALAAALIWCSGRLRGWTSYADAFFPLAILQEPFGGATWASHLCYLLPALLAGVVLVVMARRAGPLTTWDGVLVGACLLALLLNGANGVALVPVLGLWLLAVAVLQGDGASSGRAGRVVLGLLATLALVLVPVYLLGNQSVSLRPESPDPATVVHGTLAFLAAGFGVTANWQVGEVYVLVWGAAALYLFTAVALSAAVRRSSGAERLRALGLLAFLAAHACLAIGCGFARAHRGPEAPFSYVTSSAPALCGGFLAWCTVAPRQAGLFVQFGLFAFMTFTAQTNFDAARLYAGVRREGLARFEEDLKGGVPPYALIARHKLSFCPTIYDDAQLHDFMDGMRRAGLGVFRDLAPDPELIAVPLSAVPTSSQGIEWDGQLARGEGTEAYLAYRLPRPTYLAGLRLRCSHSNAEGAYFRVTWYKPGSEEPAGQHLLFFSDTFSTPRPEDGLTVYIADEVAEIRIHPDAAAFTFQVHRLRLLIPADGPPGL